MVTHHVEALCPILVGFFAKGILEALARLGINGLMTHIALKHIARDNPALVKLLAHLPANTALQ